LHHSLRSAKPCSIARIFWLLSKNFKKFQNYLQNTFEALVIFIKACVNAPLGSTHTKQKMSCLPLLHVTVSNF
jgi:hypothetical protein